MSRKFFSLLTLIFTLNILVKPVYILAIEVTVQNTVGTLGYGIYFVLLNSAYLFQILNDFGINIYNNRRTARDPESLFSSFKGLLKIKLLLALAFFACLIGFAAIAGYLAHLDLLIPIGFNLVLVSLVLFLRSGISGLGYYRTDSVLSVLDKLLLIIICGYLLIYQRSDFTIYHFIYAQTISLVVTAAISMAILLRKRLTFNHTSGNESLTVLLKSSLPFALAVFLMGIYTRIDGVMIEAIADNGQYQAGVYAAGYRLLDAANMMAYLFAVLLLPMFSRLHGNFPELRTLLSQAFRAMLVLTLFTSALCFFYRLEIMDWLYTQSNGEWGRIFGILMFSFIPVGMMYIFGTYLTALEDIRKLNLIYVTCVGVNVLLNYLLIPREGAYGAAIATLITQSAATLALMALTWRSAKLSFSARKTISMTLFIAGSLVMMYSIQYFLPRHLWIVGMVIGATAVVIFAFLMRIIDFRELRRAISSPATHG